MRCAAVIGRAPERTRVQARRASRRRCIWSSAIYRAVLDADGAPAGRNDLHLQPAAAVPTVARRLEGARSHTRLVDALLTAPIAKIHSVADSALTGIFNSCNNSRSA